MKKNLAYLILTVAAAGLLCSFRPSCTEAGAPEPSGIEGRGIVSEERYPGNFSALSCSGSTPVTYIQSSLFKVVIEGSPEFIDKMYTEVKGGTLHIGMKKGKYRGLNLRVTVYSPVMNDVHMAGSGSFHDENGHRASGDVRYSSSGSGGFSIGRLECASFSTHLSGSGSLSIGSLVCSSADISTSGSGGMTVRKIFSTGDLGIRISGSGYGLVDEANVKDVKVRISGSGSVKINGHARDISATISGSGSVMGDLDYRHLDTHTSGSGRVRL